MKNSRLFTVFALCAVVLLCGCDKVNDREDAPSYAITVISGNGGTASADKTTAEADETITLTAMANEGYEFTQWTVESGDIKLESATSASMTFTMPAGDVEIKAEFHIIFPNDVFSAITDPVFKAYCGRFDTDGDGVLSREEAEAVKKIDFFSSFISSVESLAGIEYFTELTYLDCSSHRLTELNVSNNTKLDSLYCRFNYLTALDVSYNTLLTSLWCHLNHLTALDVSNNTLLTSLYCGENQLTELDVSNNTKLIHLGCDCNRLNVLDVSNNTQLEELICHTCRLTELDVSNNTLLTYLWCDKNYLTALDVSNNTLLTDLWCFANELTALDVSNNTLLTSLWCADNQLTALDVSKNTELQHLDCTKNQLTKLDVNSNTQLIEFYCGANQLEELDVSKNTKLNYLDCSFNPDLTKIFVWGDFDLDNTFNSISNIWKDRHAAFVKK